MQRDILLITEMIDAPEQAQELRLVLDREFVIGWVGVGEDARPADRLPALSLAM